VTRWHFGPWARWRCPRLRRDGWRGSRADVVVVHEPDRSRYFVLAGTTGGTTVVWFPAR